MTTGAWLTRSRCPTSGCCRWSCRAAACRPGARDWTIRIEHGHRPDITIAVRMDVANDGVHDYYVLPDDDMTFEETLQGKDKLRLREDNGAHLDMYRLPDLGLFYLLAERARIARGGLRRNRNGRRGD